VPYERRIGSHQFIATGVLCLELGPDNWHPTHTAADMVRSAWRLIAYELINSITPIEIPSRHVSELAARVRMAEGVLVRSRDFDERLAAAVESVDFEFILPLRNLSRVFPVAFPKGNALPTLPAFRDETHFTGHFVYLNDNAPETVPRQVAPFLAFLAEFGQVSIDQKALLCVLLRWPSARTRACLILDQRVIELEDVPFEGSSQNRMPEMLREALATLKVGIVGLGSLGSKVAVCLARVGVSRFVLADGDVLLGPNVCRHAAGYADVGAPKVEVVKELIRDVSAAAPEIVTHPADLAEPTNPEAHARILESLGGTDLMIDATANPEAFCLLAMLASDRQRALVWGEVFGGGFAGLIGSAHPDQGPCPRCVRAGFLAETSTWPPAPAVRSEARYAGGDDEPLVATDADVSYVAAALTNRVLDLVARRDEPLADVIVLGLRRGWIFNAAMQTVPVRVRKDDWSCSCCWRPAVDADPEASARADALFTHYDDADSPART
jgi:hypothetical protein